MVGDRPKGVNFLWPLADVKTVVLVKKIHGHSVKKSWNVFTAPFSLDVWITTTSYTLIFGMILMVWRWNNGKVRRGLLHCVINLANCVWNVLSSNLGKKLEVSSNESRDAVRIFILFMSLNGTLAFISYRAALTTELSTVRTKLPFDNLEELSRTNYKLLLNKLSANLVQHFLNAPQGSIYNRLLENNVRAHDYWDADLKEMSELLENGNEMAYMGIPEVFDNHVCRFSVAWKNHYPLFISFAVPKDSPYYPFLQYQVKNV